MGNQEQPKNFTIKAVLVASLCALGLLVAQNASLNSQVSILQKELILRAANDSSFDENHDSINDKTNLRNLKKVVLPSSIVEVDDIEDESTRDFVKETTPQTRKNRSRKLSSKKSKSGKSSKSSKRSRDCSSSRTNDSSNDISAAECEGKEH